jgi:hypothetical protein
MASTLTTWDAFMKERYTPWKVQDLTERDNEFLSMVTKDEGFTGDGQPHPLIYNNPQGIAGVFATAQAAASNVKGKKFVLTTGDYFGVLELGDKVIKQSRSNAGAFLENKATESDGIISQMGDDLEGLCFGNGGGSIGRRASINSNTITLTDPLDAKNFFEDMMLVASDADGSGGSDALRDSGDHFTVTSVDYENGTVTVDSAAAISGFVDNDYLFRRGTFKGGSGVLIIHGLGSFVASTSISVPDLYSMVRTANPYLLAGARVKTSRLTGKNIEERLRLLGSDMKSVTKPPTHWFLNPDDWEALSTSLQSKGIRPLKDESTRFGYMALSVIAGGQEAKVFAARRCPKGTAFGVRMDTWKLFSTGKLIHPQNEDGLSMLRKSASTDYELRWLCYPVLATNAPGHNGRVPLPS